MIKRQKRGIVFFLLISLGFSYGSYFVSAKGPTVNIDEKIFEEISRTWVDIDLLYDNYFHNSTEVYAEINRANTLVPELVDLETIGYSYLGKNITAMRITNEKHSYQKAKTLVIAHHHGREQISVEIALRFVVYLLNNYQKNDLITSYIDTQEIYVIPMLNPDALDVVVNQNHHWLRKNLRPFDDDGDGKLDEDQREDINDDGIISSFDVYSNSNPNDPEYLYSYFEGIDNDGDGLVNEDMIGYTDLNRNYDAFWRDGQGWSDDTQSEIFPGESPFSEPETQAFRDFALEHRFGMAYSLHSGINATFFADGATSWAAEPNLYWQIVQDFKEILPPSYTEMYLDVANTYSPEAASNYLAGSWDNWMYYKQDTLVPITFELYRNLSSVLPESETIIVNNDTHRIIEWKGIYGYFNPEKEFINALWGDVKPGFDYLLENTPRLTIQPEILEGDYLAGKEIKMKLGITNLSPRIETIASIKINTENNLFDINTIISADSTVELEQSITLPSNLAENETEIKIGNEFAGYHVFLLKNSSTDKTLSYFWIIGLAMIVTSAFYFKKKR